MRSVMEHVNDLRAAPTQWVDTAIVVVFPNRFEFVREDCPDPAALMRSLESRGGIAIGLAGITLASSSGAFRAKVFREYEGQLWTHQHMDRLRAMVGNGSI